MKTCNIYIERENWIQRFSINKNWQHCIGPLMVQICFWYLVECTLLGNKHSATYYYYYFISYNKFLGAVKVINYHHEWVQANMFRLRFLSLTQVGQMLDSHLEFLFIVEAWQFCFENWQRSLKKVKRTPWMSNH